MSTVNEQPQQTSPSELMTSLAQKVEAFLQLLDEEKTCLQTPQTDQAEQLVSLLTQKNALIEQIDQQTHALFVLASRLAPSDTKIATFADLIEFDLFPEEQSHLQKLIELSKAVQQKNQQNGMLIQALSHLNLQALQILKGQPNTSPPVYTAKGTQSKTVTSSSLGKC